MLSSTLMPKGHACPERTGNAHRALAIASIAQIEIDRAALVEAAIVDWLGALVGVDVPREDNVDLR